MKSFAPSLAFITRFTVTRKWPIQFDLFGHFGCKFKLQNGLGNEILFCRIYELSSA